MRKLTCFLLAIAFIGCGKDDNSSNCQFVGKWCPKDAFDFGSCSTLTNIEFRSNGEALIVAAVLMWESSDCKRIDFVDKTTGTKVAEYNVISISGANMTLDTGGGPVDYVRL